jgi:ring-1,2-phenylacetyl-CoA epoxidase subunit PaaD
MADADDVTAVRRRVEEVVDPELPVLTLGMLGMVYDVRLDDGVAHIELLPTFSGCPATEMIERDVRDAVAGVPGLTRVEVRFRYSPPWSATRISPEGREALREFGIAPPGGDLTGTPAPEGRVALPLAGGDTSVRPCPWCGSDRTEQDAAFGPTPCRDLRWCHACSQPFEGFKNL